MSYGTNGPWGLRAIGSQAGATWNGQSNLYPLASGYATSLFVGDPVTFLVDGTIGICPNGTPVLGTFIGCNYYDSTNTYITSPYWTAGTATFGGNPATAMILDDRNIIYSIQCSNSGSTPFNSNQLGIVPSDFGKNAAYAVGGTLFLAPNISLTPGTTYPDGSLVQENPAAGNTRTGQSAYYLDCNSFIGNDNSAWLPLKIVGIDKNPTNLFYDGVVGSTTTLTSLPTGSFNNALVTLNNNVFQGNTAIGTVSTTITSITLTNAQILGMERNPITVTPVPPVGYMIVVSQVTFEANIGSVVLANGTDAYLAYYGTSTEAWDPVVTDLQLVNMAANSSDVWVNGNTAGVPIGIPATLANKALVFKNDTTAYTGGTGSIYTLTIMYSLVKV